MKNKYSKIRSDGQKPPEPTQLTTVWEMANPTLNSIKEVVPPLKPSYVL